MQHPGSHFCTKRLIPPTAQCWLLMAYSCIWLWDSQRLLCPSLCPNHIQLLIIQEYKAQSPLPYLRTTLKDPPTNRVPYGLGWGLWYRCIVIPLLLASLISSEVLLLGTLLDKTAACKSLTQTVGIQSGPRKQSLIWRFGTRSPLAVLQRGLYWMQ